MDQDKLEKLRLRYQTDLWLFCTELCDMPLGEAQRPVTDIFVKKDPRKSIKAQDKIRERLILMPRFFGKSWLNQADAAQWIICFPEVTIAVQTGDGDLAAAFVSGVRNYFVVPGWDGKRDPKGQPIWNESAQPTKLQKLFPETCMTEGKKGTLDAFVIPSRKIWDKDPTCFAISIESSNSGWHAMVLKNDDILTDNNVRTEVRVAAIDKRFHMSRKLLPWYGYRDTIGTRYDPDDTYGRFMKRYGLVGDAPYGNFTARQSLKYICMPAWWLKGTGPDGDGTYRVPTLLSKEEECEFLFPFMLPFQMLHDDMMNDPKTHASQYLNNPILAAESEFEREEMMSLVIDWQQLPKRGRRFMTIDLAYKASANRDYTCIAVGDWWQSTLHIVDVIRERWKADDMAGCLVNAIRDYSPEKVGIEEMLGAQWLGPAMTMEAERQGIVLPPIEWLSMGQGQKDAKVNRILGLAPLVKDKRIRFCSNIQCTMEELCTEFISFKSKGGHKDIPDAVSRLLQYENEATVPTEKEERVAAWQRIREEDRFNLLFGEGKYAHVQEPDPIEVLEPETPCDPYTGLPEGLI
jgi:hypothetical protein